jgi:hypothetical protein
MSDVTGPISSLPGSTHAAAGMCDDHPDRPAVARVQGETDSFGSEMHDLCAECLADHRKHAAEARCGTCDWCKSAATDLRARRDSDEGMYGRVYAVCGACVKRQNERNREELQRYYDACDDYDD